MMKLNSNETRSLEFGASIQGIDHNKLDGSLRIKIGEVEYGFPASITSEEITVDIPKLDNIIKEELLKDDTVVDAKLEIYGEGFYLNPWSGNFHIKVPVKVEASIKEDTEVISETPEVKVVVKKVSEKKELIVDETPPIEHGEEFAQPIYDDDDDRGLDDNSPTRTRVTTNLISGEGKKCKTGKKKKISESKPKPKTKDQLLREQFEQKLKGMTKKDRLIYLKSLQERSRIAKVKKSGAPKTPLALMESVGMTNPKIQEIMLEKAQDMGGNDPRAIMNSLEVLLGMKSAESTLEQIAATSIGKKILSE